MLRPSLSALVLALLPTLVACGTGAAEFPSGALPDGGQPAASGGGDESHPAKPAVVGYAGIAAWDALDSGEKDVVKDHRSFFLHQSVGEDLENGAEADGQRYEYATSTDTKLRRGLNGGLFHTSNGDPAAKIAEFRKMAIANAGSVRVAIMKLGYRDIVEGKVEAAQVAYKAAVADVKAAGVRVLHVTVPLVYNVPAENAPKMRFRTWMLETFADDVIFDLQDVESTEPSTGARCERGGSWEICQSVRSTKGCPSKAQGIDGPSGNGHICYQPHAKQMAKAMLYAIYLAAR